jgi:hypothetical protein
MAILVLIAAVSQAVSHSAPPAPVNLDLESGPPGGGELPLGWQVGSEKPDQVVVELSAKQVRQGKTCAILRNDGIGAVELFQTIDARPYRGKSVSFRAAIRADAKAWVWVRASSGGGRPDVTGDTSDRAASDGEWRDFDLVIEVPSSARLLRVGVTLSGRGRLRIDDGHFGIVGLGDTPPRRLTSRGLDNLVALARLFGYVRYFHPSDQAAEADWGRLAIAAIRPVETAGSAVRLAAALRSQFRPLAPSLRIAASTFPAGSDGSKIPAVQQLAWVYRGPESIDIVSSPYRRERIEVPPGGALPNNGRPIAVGLGGGVSCSLPLTVDSPGSKEPTVSSLPRSRKPGGFIASGRDRETRLAGVILAWNVFQHFYPYFDVVEVDWPAVLRAALRGHDKISWTFCSAKSCVPRPD